MDELNVSFRILGIDPGLNITGYGVLECGRMSATGGHMSATGSASASSSPRLCEAGVVRGKSRRSLTDRLVEIHEGVGEVIAGLKPDVMALEELYSHYKRRARRSSWVMPGA